MTELLGREGIVSRSPGQGTIGWAGPSQWSPGFKEDENNNIKVICRFRPLSENEVGKGKIVVDFPNNSSVFVNSRESSSTYTFDRVFDMGSKQKDIYEYSIGSTVKDFLNGYNGTVLAYGQTGAGKSYTMMGSSISDEERKGLIPRISQDIFERINEGSTDIEYSVGVSFMEIHMEQIKDLINPANPQSKYTIHEDKTQGIYVRGLSQAFVSSSKEIIHVLKQGLKNKATSATNMNSESSRSHTIFQIKLTQKLLSTGTIKKSQLFLVDLAGSEKIYKSGPVGQTLEETKKINSSLSALGLVINALTDGKSTHIPYRDSKLTRILQESLGGNSRTSLIINCSPSSINEPETLSTLRFGSRAKNIKNNAQINTELGNQALQRRIQELNQNEEEYKRYISEIEEELSQWRRGETPTSTAQLMINSSPRTPARDIQAKSNDIQLKVARKISFSQNKEEIERRDKKIEELESVILNLKMENLKVSHQEESKLFQLENSLYKLNDKLTDVALVNENLRKHLMISEKIIEARDIQIEKLRSSLKDQQLKVSKESIDFESRLNYIKDRLNEHSKKSRHFLDDENSIPVDRDNIHGDRNYDSSSMEASAALQGRNSPTSPKTGLNLRIVKPLRGGRAQPTNDDENIF